eukprot:TRINITY_DN4852_c2_g1_i1.p1 TRINITY_DN4852_c2_g1~~TRINITY_DN4852_c2_g1_i1.p1  ORF type:complete len:429 (-),score=115.88 TRINITY_DN4852_c2_g1_i1:107-1393(-)
MSGMESFSEERLEEEWKSRMMNEGKGMELNFFSQFFDVKGTIECIKQHQFKRIALQFGDEWMKYSPKVAEWLRKETNANIFILGDTSFGSCCVDEVAAEHLEGDVIIHYGRACLSLTTRLPVYYVFGMGSINLNDFESKLEETLSLMEGKKDVILFYDPFYQHCLNKLQPKFENRLRWTFIEGGLRQVVTLQEGKSDTFFGRRIEKRESEEEIDWMDPQIQSNTNFIWVGNEGTTLNNLMMTFNLSQFYSYSPTTLVFRQENINVNRALMKRYYLVQQAKDAEVIGIVVGTLGVGRYMDMIEYLKKVIRDCGKQYYTFIVGKLNVAKLANFQEIDIFVLVACPENSLIDSKDFYKPIITPFELEVALLSGREWTGRYITDFSKLLEVDASTNSSSKVEEEETRFSFISGTLKKRTINLEKKTLLKANS